MDGIFGVGLAEMLIVGLALFVIGGPKNTAKWARELGRYVRMAREAWAQVLADMESELGPEGKELMDAARELGQGAREVSRMTPTRQLMNETMRMIDAPSAAESAPEANAATNTPAVPAAGSARSDGASSESNKYPAWTPPRHNEDS